jgi:hypothetical protein
MMKRNAIALAVAALCGAPLTAAAAGHWEVMTPSSVSESAPQLLAGPHLPAAPADASIAVADTEANTPVAYQGAVTARSAEDNIHAMRAANQRQRSATRSHIARAGGMPNPQTPYSPNESGEQRYTDEMQAYKQHLASVEQARIATAESYAPAPAVAQLEPAPVDKEAAAEVDRLLATVAIPPADREREAVATVAPALVDSRASTSNELRVDTATTGESGASEITATAPVETTATTGAAEAAALTPNTVPGMPSGPIGTIAPAETSTVAAAPSAPAAETTPIEAAPAARSEVSAVPAPLPPVGATSTPAARAETQGSGPAQ